MKLKPCLLLVVVLTTFSTPAQAGWFGWSDYDVEQLKREHQKQLSVTAQQLAVQREALETWELIAGSLAIGGPLLLIIGTALGTRTRHAATRSPS